ncbi:MAG: PEP/pyruvate-binding domain-containing protein [Candidatus Kapaibacterium sp.]
MKIDKSKDRRYPSKPEWQIILGNLMFQDQTVVYRICRKMIIHLGRMNVEEIHVFMEELDPGYADADATLLTDANRPRPRGMPFVAQDIITDVFAIADQYLPDDEITYLLNRWQRQEQFSTISNVLEKRHAPLYEVIEALKKYFRLSGHYLLLSDNEKIGLRVSLIQRFLSESLSYLNIAKNFITLTSIEQLLDRIIGPPNGNGKLGGKSAGMILATQILLQRKQENPYLENFYTPKSWFLTSDGLLEFVHYNAIEDFVFSKYLSQEEIASEYPFVEYIFKTSHFPIETLSSLSMILDELEGNPIVIRSSSLLEDSFEASFSGKYKSLFLANTGTKEERMAALCNAIAEVYASTFGPDPIEYRKERGLIDFREEMAILIQEVVGNSIGKYFMPSYAGVAFSNNEFRWSSRIRRDDGVVRLVCGLGTRAVDRTINDYPRLVSPGQPGLKVNTSLDDMINYSQHYVDVINLDTQHFETITFKELMRESGGYFPGLEKIVSFNRTGMLVNPVSSLAEFGKEDLVVTFDALVENTTFIKQLREILKELTDAFGGPVDVEFASDGQRLYLLQCRPQSHYGKDSRVEIPGDILQHDIIFSADKYVSNGLVEDIEYLVYVDGTKYAEFPTIEDMYETGRIVGRLNRELPRRKFILIGPGRWGSKGDIKLGVPVIYSDINNCALLMEVAEEKEGYVPELSFGTHFFQDLVEANIKYLPMYPERKGNFFNELFFKNNRNYLKELISDSEKFESTIKVIRTTDISPESRLTVYMDGESGRAIGVVGNMQ